MKATIHSAFADATSLPHQASSECHHPFSLGEDISRDELIKTDRSEEDHNREAHLVMFPDKGV
ncbi:MAG: hypothetical protein JO121_32615 [Deltaproteobacteria bacterium]|nr:hypothetical protein [Deltaproteobacteria bacterium]